MSCGLGAEDRQFLAAAGLTIDDVEHQLTLLRGEPPRLDLARPCSLGDGIVDLDGFNPSRLEAAFDQARRAGRFSQFVPASGAASRMFASLQDYRLAPADAVDALGTAKADATTGAEQAEEAEDRRLLDDVRQLALWPDLAAAAIRAGVDLETPSRQRARTALATLAELLLGDHHLALGDRPKALIPFHHQDDGSRTAFDEHLSDAAHLVADKSGITRLHFTIGRGLEGEFERALDQARSRHAAQGIRFEASFSVQSAATDTVATAPDGALFREESGALLLRPGGHGALLPNLDAWGRKADLVFMRGIDNVLPKGRREEAWAVRRLLGGVLVELEQQIHRLLERLDGVGNDATEAEALISEVSAFVSQELAFETAGNAPPSEESPTDRLDLCRRWLERPLRVCGMVPNSGEPGGGPFWAAEDGGALRGQIVEFAEIAPDQRHLLDAATHFNPVDMVCALRDRRGRPFELAKFRNERAVFRAEKSHGGRPLVALERPGLWNGSMSAWNTVFVAIPPQAFAPVKTVFDLLRPEHHSSSNQGTQERSAR